MSKTLERRKIRKSVNIYKKRKKLPGIDAHFCRRRIERRGICYVRVLYNENILLMKKKVSPNKP